MDLNTFLQEYCKANSLKIKSVKPFLKGLSDSLELERNQLFIGSANFSDTFQFVSEFNYTYSTKQESVSTGGWTAPRKDVATGWFYSSASSHVMERYDQNYFVDPNWYPRVVAPNLTFAYFQVVSGDALYAQSFNGVDYDVCRYDLVTGALLNTYPHITALAGYFYGDYIIGLDGGGLMFKINKTTGVHDLVYEANANAFANFNFPPDIVCNNGNYQGSDHTQKIILWDIGLSFLVRLNSDGTKDLTFTDIATPSAVAVLHDGITGKIYFRNAVGDIARANSDGTIDVTFAAVSVVNPWGFFLGSDGLGNVYLAGQSTTTFGGLSKRLAKISDLGVVDPVFDVVDLPYKSYMFVYPLGVNVGYIYQDVTGTLTYRGFLYPVARFVSAVLTIPKNVYNLFVGKILNLTKKTGFVIGFLVDFDR